MSRSCNLERKCISTRKTKGSLKELVSEYIKEYRPGSDFDFEPYSKGTLKECIMRSARSIGPSGKMFDHQYRVGKKVLGEVANRLGLQEGKIRKAKSFKDIHDVVSEVCGSVPKAGTLTAYDIASRIAWKLKLMPEVVYLHNGVTTGAKNLDLDVSKGYLERKDLPKDIESLRMHEIEDFLCIFKENFK